MNSNMDGLRLDATQQIIDASPEHVLTALAKSFRVPAGNRQTLIVAENESQHTRLTRPCDKGGYGLDWLFFHHSAQVAARRRKQAYYTDKRVFLKTLDKILLGPMFRAWRRSSHPPANPGLKGVLRTIEQGPPGRGLIGNQ